MSDRERLLQQALNAIRSRLDGDSDNPDLQEWLAKIPKGISDTENVCHAIAEAALEL